MEDTIACIYLHEKDKWLLSDFYETSYGLILKNSKNISTYEVYASSNLKNSFHSNGIVNLSAPERYSQLSLKTYEMIRYCVSELKFSRLIKIDVTCALRDLSDSNFQNRQPVDPKVILNHISDSFSHVDYSGIYWHEKPPRECIEAWAEAKGGSVDIAKVFNQCETMPSWFSGKCYSISNRFANYISIHGKQMAREHAHYLMGSEDMMVGRLYEKFSRI